MERRPEIPATTKPASSPSFLAAFGLRRAALVLMGMQVSAPCLVPAQPVSAPTQVIEILQDTRFQRGLKVLHIEPATKGTNDVLNGDSIAGIIRPAGAVGEPIWRAAQWYSHFNLADSQAEQLPSGSTRFFDGAKAVTFSRPGNSDADIIMAVNGWKEWGEVAPKTVGAWPNLILSQMLLDNPGLSKFRTIHLHISYRLLRHLEADRGPSWKDGRHSAQFVMFLTLQNFNRQSAGFGDYLWFGVPMFDARYTLPIRNLMRDAGNARKRGTGKFIYNPGGAVYSKIPAVSGEWITIDHDLLPLLREALEAAWAAGFLADSHNVDDYHLGSLHINWEVTGPWDVAMQVRDLSLRPVVATEN